jgi:hypothetical protein
LISFDTKEIESKYYELERKRLSNRKRKREVGAGRPFKLKLRERFVMLLVYYRLYITYIIRIFAIHACANFRVAIVRANFIC